MRRIQQRGAVGAKPESEGGGPGAGNVWKNHWLVIPIPQSREKDLRSCICSRYLPRTAGMLLPQGGISMTGFGFSHTFAGVDPQRRPTRAKRERVKTC
jgi:hypothetical protein